MAKKIMSLLVVMTMMLSLLCGTVLATEVGEMENTVEQEKHPEVAAAKIFEDGKEHVINEDVRANGCDGAIWVKDGSKLTINGGNIYGIRCDGKKCNSSGCGYCIGVFVKGEGSVVNITGGYFENDTDGTTHCDLIYAKNGAVINISGGTFKCSTPSWTLNGDDNTNAKINVTGGKFFEYNPAIANFDPNHGNPNSDTGVAPKGAPEIFIPEGYTVVKTYDSSEKGWWYEVQPESAAKKYTAANGAVTLNENITANGCNGAVYAYDGANVTINGGNIHGQVCADCNSSMAVWALGKGTVVTINGGNFTNDSDGSEQCDMIYVKDGATIRINGGTFKCSTPSWTLNGHDTITGIIEVAGGKFYKFNPATANETEGKNGQGIAPAGKVEVKVVDGYKVIKNDDWYEVVCAHTSLEGSPLKPATLTEEGCLPYYKCNNVACGKLFSDASATVEVEMKDLILDKLIEIKGTEAVVSDAAVMGAIQNAENSSVVELPVLEASSTVKEVTVPIASVEAVAAQDKGLLIETSDVTVTLDAKTVATVAEEAKAAEKVTIEVTKEETKILNTAQKDAVKDKKVEVVISAKILADGKEISDFKGGKVTVEIPFKPAEGLTASDYKFVFIDDNGKVTEIPSKYFEGVMVVELEHFSEYAIVREEKKETTEENKTESTPAPAPAPAAPVKDNTPKTGAISVVGLVSAMAVGGLVLTRKKK